MGAPIKRSGAKLVLEEHLEELERLADTAGAAVVAQVTQQIDRPNPATYLGRGKVDELRDAIADTGASIVIFDDELSPAQGKNLEDELGKRVIDRAELILDIFATRARSSEAKMQVELAQLEYSLPRLTRMWTHLEKFRGGIGVRGPGETQLETDRRLVSNRIKLLKERLGDVERSREVQRGSRRSTFRAALVGYTNAGKSSVLRALSGASDVFVEDRLFATLDPLTREVELADGYGILVTDTVGFIRKLPHHLVASFRATLEETRDSDLLLHVIDASHAAWEEQRMVVNQVLAELGVGEKPMLHVFNKTDLLDGAAALAVRDRVNNLLPDSVFVSAVDAGGADGALHGAPDSGERAGGLEPLRRALLARVRALRPVAQIRLPAGDGKLLAEIYRAGEVLERRSEGDGETLVLTARVDPELLGRLVGRGVEVNGGGEYNVKHGPGSD
ncbi:MAG: GTPase HflX [Gemmatimonadaceae bacterium]